MLGTYYLSLLFDDFDDEVLVLCSYNAGPTNVKNWLSNDDCFDKNNNLKIPFKETKEYVEKCLRAKKYYNTKRDAFEI